MSGLQQWRYAAALAGFALLAVAQTWPLATHLSTHLPGTHIGDNAAFTWNIWWMREAIARPDASFFHTDALFAPAGARLTLHTHTALGAAAVALLPVGVVSATNLLVIACVALNGVTAFALAARMTGSTHAAVLAGVLFLGAPPITARLMGHFNLLYAWTMVIAILMFIRACDTPTIPRSVAAGVAAGLVAWADYYLFVYTVVALAVITVAHAAPVRVTRERRSSTWMAAAAAALCAAAALLGVGALVTGRTSTNLFTIAWTLLIVWHLLAWRVILRRTPHGAVGPRLWAQAIGLMVVLAPIAFAAASLWMAGEYVSPPRLWRSAPPGFDLATLVTGPPWHRLTGAVTRAWYEARGIEVMEMGGWLGISAPIMALLALREWRASPHVRVWVVVACFFFVWAAGAFLHVGGINTGLVLPQQALRYVPIVSNARMPIRALIVVSLAMAVLAALWVRTRRPAVGWVLCAVAMVEQLACPVPLVEVPRRAADEALSRRESGAVLELPFGYRDGFGMRGRFDETALLGQTVHHKPIVGGSLSRVPRAIDDLYRRNQTIDSFRRFSAGQDAVYPSCEQALADLRAAGVRYLIVAASYPQSVKFLPLVRLLDDEEPSLYELGTECP